jgi:hypothetical protein
MEDSRGSGMKVCERLELFPRVRAENSVYFYHGCLGLLILTPGPGEFVPL